MTNYYHKKGNRCVKYALLNAISDIMKDRAVAHAWIDEGYESEKDMIHFTSGGHKCILLGVACPDIDAGTIELEVLTDWDGEKDQQVTVNLNASDIHINTLDKIACEVYNRLWDPEEDEEWDEFRKEWVAWALDTYLYN